MAFTKQRLFAGLILIGSVAGGMQLALGQVPPGADLPMPPMPAGDYDPSGAMAPLPPQMPTQVPAGTMSSQPAPPALPPPAQAGQQPKIINGADLQKAQNMMKQRQQDLQQLQEYDHAPIAAPAPAAPKPFVPSEVVAYVRPVKIGEPRAILRTSFGDIKIRLYATKTPKLVKNFVELAKGEKDIVDIKSGRKTRKPYYTDMIFHRVIPGYLIQTGCPYGTGRGGPGFTEDDEIDPLLTFDRPGLVAMAPRRDGGKIAKNANGSQFLITLAPRPEWNGQLSIIGEVEVGMDVVAKIASAKTGPTDRPFRKIYLRSVDIIEEDRPTVNTQPAPASIAPPPDVAPGAAPGAAPVAPMDPAAVPQGAQPPPGAAPATMQAPAAPAPAQPTAPGY